MDSINAFFGCFVIAKRESKFQSNIIWIMFQANKNFIKRKKLKYKVNSRISLNYCSTMLQGTIKSQFSPLQARFSKTKGLKILKYIFAEVV